MVLLMILPSLTAIDPKLWFFLWICALCVCVLIQNYVFLWICLCCTVLWYAIWSMCNQSLSLCETCLCGQRREWVTSRECACVKAWCLWTVTQLHHLPLCCVDWLQLWSGVLSWGCIIKCLAYWDWKIPTRQFMLHPVSSAKQKRKIIKFVSALHTKMTRMHDYTIWCVVFATVRWTAQWVITLPGCHCRTIVSRI